MSEGIQDKKARIVIVSFVDEDYLPLRFSAWPKHITLVPYFSTLSLNQLLADVEKFCTDVHDFTLRVQGLNFLGSKKNVKVSMLECTDQLMDLHKGLLNISLTHDSGFSTRFCYPDYTPHITHNGNTVPIEGSDVRIRKVFLVRDLQLDTREKEIVAEIMLKNTNNTTK